MPQINDLGLSTLHTRIRLILRDLEDNIIEGGCKDFAEYRHATGVIKGLGTAERELLDLAKEMEEKD